MAEAWPTLLFRYNAPGVWQLLGRDVNAPALIALVVGCLAGGFASVILSRMFIECGLHQIFVPRGSGFERFVRFVRFHLQSIFKTRHATRTDQTAHVPRHTRTAHASLAHGARTELRAREPRRHTRSAERSRALKTRDTSHPSTHTPKPLRNVRK